MRLFLQLFFALSGILIAGLASAQQRITGNVTSAKTNEPLVGAAVVSGSDSKNGVVTDTDGNYSIVVSPDDKTLEFRFVGYESQIVNIEGRTVINVALVESSGMLDQVVVVGYGTQRKSDLTGSVGTVQSRDIERLPVANVEQALQGQVAGVYVTPNSGTPGAGATVRIRGTGTLNNANPLYVIDGMITYDATLINPQDVASIEVLKDASAAAIYGSRGANGVIIITTKNGSGLQKGQVTLSTYRGIQQVTNKIRMANAAQFAQLYNELRGTPYYPDPASLGEGTDWQDVVFRDAPISNIQLAATGGSKVHTYNFSGSYFDQKGIVRNSSFDRLTLRANNHWQVKPWLGLGNNTSLVLTRERIVPDVVTEAYRMPPVFAPKDSLGDFSDPTFFGMAIGNPAASLEYNTNNKRKGDRLLGNLYGEFKFLKGFTFRSNLGFDRANFVSRSFTPKYEVSGSQLNNAERLNMTLDWKRDWIWEQTLRYDKDLGKHRFNVLAGYTADERRDEFLSASRENFPGNADELLYLNAGNDTTMINSGGASDEALISYLFRVNYALLDRYLLTASWRTDKSSRFIPENRTGHFPSASIGWNAGMEPFISALGVFDRLKFRLSYGILGNQASTGRYPAVGVIQSGLYGVFGPDEALNQGATLTSLTNRNLRWETTKQVDFGVEMGFFDNRLQIEVDRYRRHTFDIIAAVPIPDYVGSWDDPIVNTAEVINKGWDITANWRQNIPGGNWFIGGVYSPLKNEVLKLSDARSQIFAAFLQGEPASLTVVGGPIGGFYGYKVAGIFRTQEELDALPKMGNEKIGDIRYADLNNDNVINGEDRTFLGSPIPTLTYGINGGIEWHGVDILANFFGVSGNKVFNAKKTFRFGVYNWEESFFDRWSPDNPNGSQPRITNGGHNYRVSDRFIEDGSFFRLRALSLGYSLPVKHMARLNVQRLRIYVLGNNIWTRQAYSGYSPEFSNSSNPYEVGFDFGGYPIARSWQLGFDMTF